ncbi:MAG: hypothetical protein RIT27_1431 [Pseudomonadota bacterium]|jgi:methyltransferase-like protein/SAM-dependent methyltransferase
MVSNITNYDELPYFCMARPLTHPVRLAGVLHFLGIPAPAVNQCRVLELGCGDGTNLCSMAIGFPNSFFVGYDLSTEQIKIGISHLEQLNIKNIVLYQSDIMDLDKEIGLFDYIIVHGVYSWVSESVQNKILSLCANHLTENGVAYISYNTRPGWNLRMTIRDMLLYHTRELSSITDKLTQMKAWLQFVEQHVGNKIAKMSPIQSDYAYYRYLKNELPEFIELPDSYLFHEFLEENNAPVYFYQFIEKVTQHHLIYVGDADIKLMFRTFQSPEILNVLGELDTVSKEQYFDFLENRQFRMSILCKEGIKTQPELLEKQLEKFYFTGAAVVRSKEFNLAEGKSVEFENAEVVFIEQSTIGKAALSYLSERYPETIPFEQLFQGIKSLISKTGYSQSIEKNELIETLIRFAIRGLIEVLPYPLPITLEAGDYPFVSPLARLELAEKKTAITSLRQDSVVLNNPILTYFMPYLDGLHSRNDLIDLLQRWVNEGKITSPPLTIEPTRELLETFLNHLLQAIGKMGYLLKV